MNRAEFQQLAEVRIKEAEALLAAGLWDGAYYLAGYAVECALKACIAKLTRADDFPPRETRDYYTHDLGTLLKTAGLRATRDAEAAVNPRFYAFWTAVTKWNEQARYGTGRTQAVAEELFQVITDPTDGVLQWVRRHW